MSGGAKIGGCLCGAVRFTATRVPATFATCHCEMCRRWTGSALLGVTVKDADIDWQGADHIARRQTSDWAERAWCAECGSNLFYRVTADNEWAGGYEIPLGLFDDPDGFEMTHEIWIDHKPDSFAFAGERRTLTRAECAAKFPDLGGE